MQEKIHPASVPPGGRSEKKRRNGPEKGLSQGIAETVMEKSRQSEGTAEAAAGRKKEIRYSRRKGLKEKLLDEFVDRQGEGGKRRRRKRRKNEAGCAIFSTRGSGGKLASNLKKTKGAAGNAVTHQRNSRRRP